MVPNAEPPEKSDWTRGREESILTLDRDRNERNDGAPKRNMDTDYGFAMNAACDPATVARNSWKAAVSNGVLRFGRTGTRIETNRDVA